MRLNKIAMMVMTGLMAASPFASAQASESWEWAVTPVPVVARGHPGRGYECPARRRQ